MRRVAFRAGSASWRDGFPSAYGAVLCVDQRLSFDKFVARSLGLVAIKRSGQHLRMLIPVLDHTITGFSQRFKSFARLGSFAVISSQRVQHLNRRQKEIGHSEISRLARRHSRPFPHLRLTRTQRHHVCSTPISPPFAARRLPICRLSERRPRVSVLAGVECLHEVACFADHKAPYVIVVWHEAVAYFSAEDASHLAASKS